MANKEQEKFISDVKNRFPLLTFRHRHLISRELNKLSSCQNDKVIELQLSISEKLEEYLEFFKERENHIPKLTYDDNLPVSQKREEIIEAIKANQVVIIAGETGSGKTTQIPKMCLEAGLGRFGFIGHTQPRRIAARAVSTRIAAELGEELGQSVGYKVRFNDVTSDTSYIKLMTDGILLAETAHDRKLLNYDCIIIDEAHERSLNIDFLLGYLKKLLKVRSDLKLIITSATINTKRFSEHFDNAPIIEVSGRTYPVEVVYRPLGETEDSDTDDEVETDEKDLRNGILNAIRFLFKEYGREDILVFLPGEREIMDIAKFLSKAHLPNTEILPLYARLATSDQNKIFAPHSTVRVVLATNVAETSLTVPGIKYVIDPGTARISRYSPRTKVQSLPIEKISKASADQRKGRCGRVSEGVCVRLYSKEDFDLRQDFTDPEILRTNLASVILQMVSLRLGNITVFPFIDPPSGKQITDGIRLLEEVGAINESRGLSTDELRLTKIGTDLSKIPCDPRLSRMLVEANKEGALSEVLVIVSAMAVMDPRERPVDKQEQSRQLHSRFDDEKSDFLAYLNLYHYICKCQKEMSNSQLRKKLKSEFISYLRVREWFDLLRQLRASCQILKYTLNDVPAGYDAVHRSILSGLLSQVGHYDDNDKGLYLGARGIKFVIHPSSVFNKKKPKWICAGELNETSRLFARTVASIDPLWVESIGRHLVKKNYAEPHWSKSKGSVVANLTISLYGLPVVQGRKVLYTSIDPKLCRELFIRDGLVGGDIECNHAFFRHNLDVIDEVEHVEDKLRRRDLLVDSSVLEEFYDKKLPEDILTQKHFDKWWKEKHKSEPDYLNFSIDLVSKDAFNQVEEHDFPEFWHYDSFKLPLSYVFDPTSKDDGVTVHIPLAIVNRINSREFAYQIPGLRLEFLTSLIKSLPKRLRKNLIPAPNYAKALSESIGEPCKDDLYVKAAKELTRMGGEIVSCDDFDKTLIEKHLFMIFSIEDEKGKVIKKGRNFDAIAASLQGQVKDALSKYSTKTAKVQKPLNEWNFGTIKTTEVTRQNGIEITAYPALTDKGQGVTLELYDSKYKQQKAMWIGQRKLLSLGLKQPTAYLEQHLPNKSKLSMYYQPLGTVKDLINDLMLASIDVIMVENNAPVYDEESFKKLLEKVRADLNDTALKLCSTVEKILLKAHELKRKLKGQLNLAVAYSYKDMAAQLDSLVYKGFLSSTKVEYLEQIPRYLDAMLYRIEKVHRDVNRDLVHTRKIEEVNTLYKNTLSRYKYTAIPDDLINVKWLIEELRVSYFAQQLGVRVSISDKRISNELNRILEEFPEHG
ncbi:MAG: ATP-dependent RNA helicase HrpA [Succinivibrio dextrinosolvens]|nr:ATP-dependent RNA helicase HrpA [Succinivibrio dextrinosolvens]